MHHRMPWARFARQWGGADINAHRESNVDDIVDEQINGTRMDPDAHVYNTVNMHEGPDGDEMTNIKRRLTSKWGTVLKNGKRYAVSEADTFTWKEVPPEAAVPIGGVAPDGGDDGGDGGASPEYGYAPDEEESYVGSVASTPPRPRPRARVTARIARGPPRTITSIARSQMTHPRPRVHINPRRYDLPSRRGMQVITPPGSDEDVPPAPAAFVPARRARAFRDASPAPRAAAPRRSGRERIPVGFYDPTLGKGFKCKSSSDDECRVGRGGYITSSDGAYTY